MPQSWVGPNVPRTRGVAGGRRGDPSAGPYASPYVSPRVGRRGGPRRRVAVVPAAAVAAVAALAAPTATATATAAPATATTTPATATTGDRTAEAFTIRDDRITESSGLAASHAHPGVYWTHNDSDDGPYVYAVDGETGKTVATVTLEGVDPRDVEAISLGPDGDLYVGDIGDNLGGTWSEVWIYRFPEPAKLRDTTVTPTRYTVRYADGPRDAESLMVHPDTGRVYIASKNAKEKGGVYAGPKQLSASGVNVFRRIAGTAVEATGGAFSPDGTRLVLRSYFGAVMYRWTASGRPEAIDSVPVSTFGQGESVTFTPDGDTLMFGSEGANSRVAPQPLEGEVLPESAAARAEASGGDSGRQHGTDGSPASEAEDRDLVVGALTFAAAVVIWMGLRRLFRRRD